MANMLVLLELDDLKWRGGLISRKGNDGRKYCMKYDDLFSNICLC